MIDVLFYEKGGIIVFKHIAVIVPDNNQKNPLYSVYINAPVRFWLSKKQYEELIAARQLYNDNPNSNHPDFYQSN